jgi:cyanophycinase
MVDEAKRPGAVLIVTNASAFPEESFEGLAQPLREMGLEPEWLSLGEEPAAVEAVKIANARLIFLTGGDQNRLMAAWNSDALRNALKEAHRQGTMVGGTSAGAAVMSEVMITGNQLRDTAYAATFPNLLANNLETAPGLGLVQGAVVDQHFVVRSRYNRLLTALCDYKLEGWGIDESTALLIRGDIATVVGQSQVIRMRNPGLCKTDSSGRFSMRNVVLDVYLPGDTFHLPQP